MEWRLYGAEVGCQEESSSEISLVKIGAGGVLLPRPQGRVSHGLQFYHASAWTFRASAIAFLTPSSLYRAESRAFSAFGSVRMSPR